MKVNRIQLFCFFLFQTKFIHLSCVVVVAEKSDRDIWRTNKNKTPPAVCETMFGSTDEFHIDHLLYY